MKRIISISFMLAIIIFGIILVPMDVANTVSETENIKKTISYVGKVVEVDDENASLLTSVSPREMLFEKKTSFAPIWSPKHQSYVEVLEKTKDGKSVLYQRTEEIEREYQFGKHAMIMFVIVALYATSIILISSKKE